MQFAEFKQMQNVEVEFIFFKEYFWVKIENEEKNAFETSRKQLGLVFLTSRRTCNPLKIEEYKKY